MRRRSWAVDAQTDLRRRSAAQPHLMSQPPCVVSRRARSVAGVRTSASQHFTPAVQMTFGQRPVRRLLPLGRASVARRCLAWPRLAVAALVLASCGGDPAAPDVPPLVAVTSATGVSAVSSGSTLQLVVKLTDKRGVVVASPTLTWTSANPLVASVSAAGLVTGAVAGTTTISATANGTTGTLSVTVSPGVPARLVLVTQPAGAFSGAPLTTQPVVEIRDGAENVVTAATATVTVSILSGGGVLSGSATIPATLGVARFFDLAVSGATGPRALLFTASGLRLTVESSSFALLSGPPSAIVLVASATALRSGVATSTPFIVALRDPLGNDVALAGRRIVATVSGGTGTTAISGAVVNTDAQGRASFTNLAVAGVIGTRQLLFRADSITPTVSIAITLTGGRPRALTFERDAPESGEIGVALSPSPIVRLVDSVGNGSPEARVAVRAAVVGGSNTIANDSVVTDSLGRAVFATLVLQGTVGARTLRFTSTGLPSVSSRTITLVPRDTNPSPAFISTALSGADTSRRVIVLSSPTGTLVPFLSARDAQQVPISTAGIRWTSRDPSRATVGVDGRITGVREGRTFVVAQASRDPAVADSVLVFVPGSATGPILRATLPSYRIATDTFSIIVQVESRDGRTLSAADFEVAWPGANAFPYSPFTVTSVTTLSPGVVTGQVDRQENVRVTWATATPVAGAVPLVRLLCRVNQRNIGNQLILTLNQLLAGDLTSLTATTSVFNPIVIIP